MPSRDSYQCSSQQDDDEEAEGHSPTSIWKKRKRKDYSDEDYDPDEVDYEEEETDEDEEDEDDEEPEEEGEGQGAGGATSSTDSSCCYKGDPSSGELEENCAHTHWRGVPRHCLSSANSVANLNRREIMYVPTKDLRGEWDRHLPKRKAKEAGPEWPEWKPSKEYIGVQLWNNLTNRAREFRQAYSLMMEVIKDIQDNYQPEEFKRKK